MADTRADPRARLIFDRAELMYNFGAQHPLQPDRLASLIELLERSRLWQSSDERTRLPLRSATVAELGLVHTPEYIAAVQLLSASGKNEGGTSLEDTQRLALRYGFEDGDTPALPGMHKVSSDIAGGTLIALSAVMGLAEGGVFKTESERPLHVFHPGGGLHHAWAERASGFCIYNDISVAIAHVLRATEAKVLYVDFDAHHGDGVQRSFYAAFRRR